MAGPVGVLDRSILRDEISNGAFLMRFAFARAAVRSFILAFMANAYSNSSWRKVLVLSLDSGIFLGLTSPSNIDHYPIGSATSKP